MALTKAQIITQIDNLLASNTSITASEHRQTMYETIDKVYDENIDGVSLSGTDLVFTRDAGNGSSTTVDLSLFLQDVSGISVNASAISTLQSEQSSQDSAIALNTAKVGITTSQSNAIVSNTAALDGVQLESGGAGDKYLADDGSYKTVSSGGGGDMSTSTYDPANKSEQVLTVGDSSSFATSTQGAKADTAIQAGDLSTVATSGSYNDLSNKPTTITTSQANDITTNNSKISYDDAALVATHTSDISALNSNKLDSVTTGEPAGSDVLGNAVSLTQAEYDAASGSRVSTTVYVIKD